jgi:hypothetical protein
LGQGRHETPPGKFQITLEANTDLKIKQQHLTKTIVDVLLFTPRSSIHVHRERKQRHFFCTESESH